MMVKLNMSVMGQPGLSSTDIVSGLLCCASSIIDKRWYRAVVISAHDGSGGVSLCEGRGGGCGYVREGEESVGVCGKRRSVWVCGGGEESVGVCGKGRSVWGRGRVWVCVGKGGEMGIYDILEEVGHS